MGRVWLGSLPDVLRDAGLDVDVFPGWETRSRSTGGYESLLGIQVHHTATRTTPQRDMEYMWRNAPSRPIGAVLLDRTGRWTVGAAGATNTSGRGGPIVCSKGTVPVDRGNLHLLAVEAANDGVGEVWPDPQLWSYVIGVAALARAYDFNPLVRGDVHGHFEYTSRKIDPAGPSWYSPDRRSWNMTKFRSNVSTVPPPGPPPLQGVPDVFTPIRPHRTADTTLFGGPGIDPGRPHRFGVDPAVVPANAVAVAANFAVIPAGQAGWLSVWPANVARPNPITSVINYEATGAHNGAAIVGVHQLQFDLQLMTRAHVVVDITGYWTP